MTRKSISFFIALLALFAIHATARKNPLSHITIPATAVPDALLRSRIERTLQQVFDRAKSAGALAANKNTAVEPVLRELIYDYTFQPSSQLTDSLSLTYSGGRGSQFDYNNLAYDYDNASDDPGNKAYAASSYVNFDTLRHTGSNANIGAYRVRTYNAAGKVTRFEIAQNQIIDYRYDASGRLANITTQAINSMGTAYDSSIRDFYTYNSSGVLLRDSTQSWNGASWDNYIMTVYTNNAAGFPTQVSTYFYAGPVRVLVFQVNITYTASNLMQTAIGKGMTGGAGGLQNLFKDSSAYNGTSLIANDQFNWDTTARAWQISSQERRHLNVSLQPDSIRSCTFESGVPSDSNVITLSYNPQGNPAYLRTFERTSTTPVSGTKWYYASTPNAVANIPASVTLTIAPNPAGNTIRVSGNGLTGRYSILDRMGRMLQDGILDAMGTAPVSQLAPGTYVIRLEGSNGGIQTASFVRP